MLHCLPRSRICTGTGISGGIPCIIQPQSLRSRTPRTSANRYSHLLIPARNAAWNIGWRSPAWSNEKNWIWTSSSFRSIRTVPNRSCIKRSHGRPSPALPPTTREGSAWTRPPETNIPHRVALCRRFRSEALPHRSKPLPSHSQKADCRRKARRPRLLPECPGGLVGMRS